MYRFAVCDDNSEDISYVTALLEKWSRAVDIPVQIKGFPSAEAFLFAWEEEKRFDVLILDVEMGGMSGVELAKKLRLLGASMQLIFLTGYMEYIAEGYDVEALNYLLKPVTEERLGDVLNRAAERLKTRENVLILSLPDGMVTVPQHEIKYLEVMRNYVTIHAGEDISIKRTLNELESKLDECFFRIHRSYIVNLRFVRKVAKTEVTLKDGSVLPLSRKMYDGLNRAMIEYF